MTPNEYQKAAHSFASSGDNIAYPFAGLAEEAGEVNGKFAKFIRKHDGINPLMAEGWTSMQEDCEKFKDDISKELGDVMWMVAEIATQFHLSLEYILEKNIEKLSDRLDRGVIIGEGDDR